MNRAAQIGRRVRSGGETSVYDDYLNVGATVWDPTEPVATRPLVWLAGDGPAYCFHDGNKNVTDVVAGSAFARYSYAPFGRSEAEGALADENPYRFSSEYYDIEQCTVCYTLRSCNVQEGRWIQRDPGEEIFSRGLYLFVDNKPINRTDFLGMDGCHTSNSDFSMTKGFKFGVGEITVSYHKTIEQTQCVVTCPDCSKGYSIVRNITSGGGSGGTWKIIIFGIPVDLGYSWTMSGGESYSYDSCSGQESRSQCNSFSVSFSGGPCVKIGPFIKWCVKGNMAYDWSDCGQGKDELNVNLELEQCYFGSTGCWNVKVPIVKKEFQ